MSLLGPFISISEVVANAATLVPRGKNDPYLRNLMRQWTYLGEKQLGFSGLHEKAEQLTVSGINIRKPDDYAVGIDMALFDANSNEYNYHHQGRAKRIHSENNQIYSSATGTSVTSWLKQKIGVSEDPYYFYLDSDADGTVTICNLLYYSYPLDDNGDMLIPDHHLFALTMFNYWMFVKRERYNQAEIQVATQDWLRESVKAKGKNKMPSPLVGKDIALHHMSMIDKIFDKKF